VEEGVANIVHRRSFTIQWGACDPAGLVLNSRVFEFFDENTWSMFETVLGVARADLFATYDIMGVPLVDARARFVLPVRFGDEVEIESEIAAFRRSSFDVRHRLARAGATVVEGSETRVWATRDKADPTRIRSTPIPTSVVDRFTSS
jgi:4-hydroxybenzoyl-CoA thioesterase